MKFLFDQNLSRRLIDTLEDLYPDAIHVSDLGLATADDREIWEYARLNEFTIVSKDSDFRQLSFIYGYPPKTLWLRIGNCSTQMVSEMLRSNYLSITNFINNDEAALLVISEEDF
jgi:predicted nuclease of predicted toxin-antitoxin system